MTGAYELAEWTAEDHAAAVGVVQGFGSGNDDEPLWGASAFRILPYGQD